MFGDDHDHGFQKKKNFPSFTKIIWMIEGLLLYHIILKLWIYSNPSYKNYYDLWEKNLAKDIFMGCVCNIKLEHNLR